MKIQNRLRKNTAVLVAGSQVVFDAQGIADVDDVTGKKLLTLKGYREIGAAKEREADARPESKNDIAAASGAQTDLESMSAAQLKKLAKDLGVDAASATKKSDLIELIKTSGKA